MSPTTQQLAPLRAFGYSDAEARFLYLVAAHSGYFTVKQFLRFSGAKSGKRSARFIQKLLVLGHASSQRCLRNSLLYHLDSRPLYSALAKNYLRHRRGHEPAHIRSRLMALDFILSHPEYHYFETAEAKRNFFRDQLKVSPCLFECLPGQPAPITLTDGFPLFLTPQSQAFSPVVTFAFVDSEGRDLARYLRHLRAYRPLYHLLECFQFLYISAKSGLAAEANVLFSLFVEGQGLQDLLRYFDLKKKWDTRRLAELKTDDFIFLNERERIYSGQSIQSLYMLWKRNLLPPDLKTAEELQLRPNRRIMFRAVAVPTQEGLFGPDTRRWGDGWQRLRQTRSPSPEHSPLARTQAQRQQIHA